jgi:hypothetical protein
MKLKLLVAALSFALIAGQANALVPASAPKTQHVPAGVWVIFGCTGSLMISALAANYVQHRQLTGYEAATCGIAFWLTPPRTR